MDARPPTVVVDASVGAKWYLDDEEGTAPARALVEQFERRARYPIVPDCFYYEVAGVIRAAERRRPPRITSTRGDEICLALSELSLYSFASQLLLPDAARLSRLYEVSLYDALYVALAELAAATLVTADERLYTHTQHLQYVHLLGSDSS